ncbi:MAG: CDP-diacylglycerol--glycerol-3-phosphate 3-phosphatidyltransferase, partial [Bacteriovoracaceae bacterium]|nr:CDP-diacylglycerol--glycerol-3-phosphate 3-phosphatidyltransferase [Bacteriovoracaceae bacterium]
PNRLTIFRICLIPVVLAGLLINHYGLLLAYQTLFNYLAAFFFVVASVTDFIDGRIARQRGLVTTLGSFLDPIADKFLVLSSLIVLLGLGRIDVISVIILALRELYITSLRLLAAERGHTVPVGRLGKWKTATQMVGIPLLMAYDHWGPLSLGAIGRGVIYLSIFFSVYSAAQYSVAFIRKMQEQVSQKVRKRVVAFRQRRRKKKAKSAISERT